jgi:hypothetical protein
VQGVLAMCTGNTGRGGLARVLAGLGRGDGVLWVGVGEATMVGIVQREEGQRGGVRAASSFCFHVARPGSGQRGLGSTAEDSTSMATGSRRTGTGLVTVAPILWIFAHQVLDIMPARNSISNFCKFSLWVVNILDKDPRTIFVLKKYHVLQKSNLNVGVWSLFRIQTLADV